MPTGVSPFELEFSPALPAGATVVSVKQRGKIGAVSDRGQWQRRSCPRRSSRRSPKPAIEVRYRGGISVDVPWQPILEGDSSRNLRVLKTSYQNGEFQMLVEGRPELKYEIRLLTPWRVSWQLRRGCWSRWRLETSCGSRTCRSSEHPDKAGYVRWTVDVP